MNDITTSPSGLMDTTNSLLQTLQPVLQKLADTFCVSVDYLQEHAMDYIMMYGKYNLACTLTKGLGLAFGLIIITGLIVGIIVRFIMLSEEYNDASINKAIKLCTRITLSLFVVTSILIIFCTCFPYWISPEIYSINIVLKLAQSI